MRSQELQPVLALGRKSAQARRSGMLLIDMRAQDLAQGPLRMRIPIMATLLLKIGTTYGIVAM